MYCYPRCYPRAGASPSVMKGCVLPSAADKIFLGDGSGTVVPSCPQGVALGSTTSWTAGGGPVNSNMDLINYYAKGCNAWDPSKPGRVWHTSDLSSSNPKGPAWYVDYPFEDNIIKFGDPLPLGCTRNGKTLTGTFQGCEAQYNDMGSGTTSFTGPLQSFQCSTLPFFAKK